MLLKKKGDKLLFLHGKGLSLVVDSSHRKSSLSPLGTLESLEASPFYLFIDE